MQDYPNTVQYPLPPMKPDIDRNTQLYGFFMKAFLQRAAAKDIKPEQGMLLPQAGKSINQNVNALCCLKAACIYYSRIECSRPGTGLKREESTPLGITAIRFSENPCARASATACPQRPQGSQHALKT